MINSPHDLAEENIKLADYYGKVAEELVKVKVLKAEKWVFLRTECKSDNQCDKAWEKTEDGLKELTLHYKLKTIEKKMSAARKMIDVLNCEAKNQW